MTRCVFYRSRSMLPNHATGVQLDEIDRLNSDDIFFINDVFEQQELIETFSQKGSPGCVVNDQYESAQNLVPGTIPFYTAAFFPEIFSAPAHYVKFDDTVDTKHTANFVVNKSQVNRYLTAKLVEWYGIDAVYTLSQQNVKHDMTQILEELFYIDHGNWLDQTQKNFLLSSVTLPVHTLEPNYRDVSNRAFINLWVSGLDKIFSKSAVALITESVAFQKGAVFTEKTVFPMLALNFPIWVGGFGQADAWKRCGFDIFDDVIDHSYQYLSTVIERCWWAFKLNIKILQNKPMAEELRDRHLSRLKHNRQLILDNHLKSHHDRVVAFWPENVQMHVLPWLQAFRKDYNGHINIHKEI